MGIHRLGADEALTSMKSGSTGLSSVEAQHRLREYGRNELAATRRANPLAEIVGHFIGPFPIVLLVAATLSFVLATQTSGEDMQRLGITIIVVVVVSGAFSYWQAFRAERTLAAPQRLLPARVQALRAVSRRHRPTIWCRAMSSYRRRAIAQLSQRRGGERSPLQRQLDHLSRRIVALAVGLGVLFFAIGWAIGIPVWTDLISPSASSSRWCPRACCPRSPLRWY